MTKKIKKSPGQQASVRKICSILGYVGYFGACIIGLSYGLIYGFIFFLAIYCPAHAYLIISQSYFNGKRGTNRYRRVLGRWAPFTNIPPLLFMIYLLAVAANGSLLISFGALNDIFLRVIGILWFLSYFFISPPSAAATPIGGAGLYPLDSEYSKEIFSRFETILYAINLSVLVSVVYVYMVKGFAIKTQAKVVNQTLVGVVSNVLAGGFILMMVTLLLISLALIGGWVYLMKIKKYPKRTKAKKTRLP